MLDPEVKPSPAKEMVHKGKGCLAVLVAAAILAFGGYFVWDRASSFVSAFGEVPDYPGPGGVKVIVQVPPGSSLDVIGGILVEQDVVKSGKAWRQAVRAETRAQDVQAGGYVMRVQMKAADALGLLLNPGGSRIRSQFTVPEGLRLSAQVDVLTRTTKIKKTAFDTALKRPQDLGLPKYADNRPEGYLFPDTYELTADSTATSTMRQMVGEYKQVAKEIGLEASAKRLKRDPEDLVTVASIIEKEVDQDKYRAKVAQVLYNRLDKGMKLGLDSTVIYAGNLKTNTTTAKDRANPSPYNTYKHKGLPPGPISAPGKLALQAASQPEKGKWLYFVTVNFDTGLTKFANTEAEFEKLRAEFQAYCQANPGKCDS